MVASLQTNAETGARRERLPAGWRLVAVGELCEIIGGGTPKRSVSRYFGGDILWITPTDLPANGPVQIVTDSRMKLSREGLASSSAKLVPAGTVLFSSRATVGKVAIAGVPLATNQGFANFICGPRLYNRYLAWCLKAQLPDIKRLASSTTYPEVSRGRLRQHRIPLPFPEDPTRSMAIQRETVAQIEVLLDELKDARVLAAAIGRDTDRIIEAATEDVLRGLGTIQFGSLVASYKNGIYKPTHYYGRGYPSVRMFNIKEWQVDLENAPLLDVTPAELRTYGLDEGDILVNRVNSRELVGKTGLVPAGLGLCTFESKNIRVRIKRDLADPAFVVAALNSTSVRQQILRRQKPAIGQATVNQDDLSELQIPFIADMKKQRRVVAGLDSVRAEVAQVRRLQIQNAELLDQLEQSILGRAFRDEL